MSGITNKAATLLGIERCGFRPVANPRTKKYRVFHDGDGGFFFVGRSGALRSGKNVSHSISNTGRRKHAAFQYVGRLHKVQLSTSEAEKHYRQIWWEKVLGGVAAS